MFSILNVKWEKRTMWERESSGLNGAATFNLPISTWDTIVFLAELSLCESSDRRVLKWEGGQMWISAGRSWEGESVYHFQITHPTEMRRELGTHRRENKYLFGKRVFFSFSLFFLQNHSQQTTTLKHLYLTMETTLGGEHMLCVH